MYCEKCGSKISVGDRFCEKCGNPVEIQAVQAEQEKTVRKLRKGWIIGGVTVCVSAAAIVILVGISMIGSNHEKKKTDNIAAAQPNATAVVTESPLVSSEPEESISPSASPEPEETDSPKKEEEKGSSVQNEDDIRENEEDISEEDSEEDSGEDFMLNTPEEAYADYLRFFINAVNTGETMDLLIAMDGKCHDQQCAVAEDYYSRGIREELQSYSVLSVKEVNEECVKLTAKEKIKVFYSDGSEKIVNQKYRYTLKLLSHKWYITNMKSV